MIEKKLQLYLHIPFCVQKCRYCDFLSAPAEEEVRTRYVDKLIEEIEEKGEASADYTVMSVFLGGGTPSILEGEQIGRLMQALRQKFQIEDGAEITMECNPGTLTAPKVFSYKKSGINRISMGLQSANNQELKKLGRLHTFEQFLENYELVRNAGFDNVNLDLMSALPGQTLSDWSNTLTEVVRLNPEHLSAYSLIVEEGTPFYQEYAQDELRRERGESPLFLPDEATERAMYQKTNQILGAHGYQQYEISNYARPGRECRHNIGYWTRENYLGLGLGSASLMENVRFSNTGNLQEYLGSKSPLKTGGGQDGSFEPSETECLDTRQQMEEFMFLGLRLRQGVNRNRFRELFRSEMEEIYGAALKKLLHQGLLKQENGQLYLSEEGISVSNYVMSEFLLD